MEAYSPATQQALARRWPCGLRKAGRTWATIMASSWLQYGSCSVTANVTWRVQGASQGSIQGIDGCIDCK